jgi:hypothetical protein
MSSSETNQGRGLSRRAMLGTAAGVAVGAAWAANLRADHQQGDEPVIRKGRIRQSLVHWTYAPYWNMEQMIEVAKRIAEIGLTQS